MDQAQQAAQGGACGRQWADMRGLGDHAPHEVAALSDLCLDHDGPILCRRINGRKGATYDKNSRAAKGGDRPVPAL